MEFQEYPRLLYKGDETKRVNNDDEKKAALKAGFALLPGAAVELTDPVMADLSDDDAVDAEIAAPKKKPGRPKKAE